MEPGETLGDIVPQPDGSVLVAASYQPASGGASGYGIALRRLLPWQPDSLPSDERT